MSAITILCDFLDNFLRIATWNVFFTDFLLTEALKLCFQRGAVLYYLKFRMYRKLCIWSEAKKVLKPLKPLFTCNFNMYVGYNKKKNFVGYLISLKFLAILSFVDHFGLMHVFYDLQIIYDVPGTTLPSRVKISVLTSLRCTV